MPLQVQLVSPEQVLFDGEAEMVVCTTSEGEVAFLPGHVPFVGALGVAKVRILTEAGGEEVAAVHGGFVEVAHDRVIILSDVAELPHHIDAERARRAQERLAHLALTSEDLDPGHNEALKRANLRVDVFNYFTQK